VNGGEHILLVEDDRQLGRALVAALEGSRYAVEWARTVAAADLSLRTTRFAAALLDLGLPDGSGFDLLAALRRRRDRTPVLILTARDALEDRVRGLDGGADDYLVKPFAVPELLSRIRALIRRAAGFADRIRRFGGFELDLDAWTLSQGGAPVSVSRREFQVLAALARQGGRVVTRAQLEEAIFDLGEEPESNSLEVHVHNLRRKLGGERIRTVRGLGYLLELDR
jgi:DNA-binding response OmpR family regulator